MKKKLLSILLVGVMALSLSACGGKEKEKEPEEPKTEEIAEEELQEESGNYEDEYEIVDSIDIDGKTTKLKFNRSEKYTMQGGEEVIVAYFNFENVSAGETSLHSEYNFGAYQDGTEITVYSTTFEETEAFENADKSILSGASIEVALAIKPSNWYSPIKLRVDNQLPYEMFDGEPTEKEFVFQQQEINIK